MLIVLTVIAVGVAAVAAAVALGQRARIDRLEERVRILERDWRDRWDYDDG